jgi:hypothetical protein
MGLQLIGAGFGRTGQLSLKAALEQLSLGPYYHMAELLRPRLLEERPFPGMMSFKDTKRR